MHDINVLENPFARYKIGQTVTAKIVAKPNESGSQKMGSHWELSVRSKMLTGLLYDCMTAFYLFKFLLQI